MDIWPIHAESFVRVDVPPKHIDKSGKIAVAYVGVVINRDNVETNIKGLLSER